MLLVVCIDLLLNCEQSNVYSSCIILLSVLSILSLYRIYEIILQHRVMCINGDV